MPNSTLRRRSSDAYKDRARAVARAASDRTVSYSSYLQLDKILNAQKPQSSVYGTEAHDEMMFIVVHQCYELWFKLIMHELDEVIHIFMQPAVLEENIAVALRHLQRITEILKVMVDTFAIMETMTPPNFLKFRDYINPASGFQSWQFRLFENRLGLDQSKRVAYQSKKYSEFLPEDVRPLVEGSETEPSLFSCLEKWLERMPFLRSGNWNFVSRMRDQIQEQQDIDQEVVPQELEGELGTALAAKLLKENNALLGMLDPENHEEMVRKGMKRLSFRATMAALMIQLYSEEPVFQLPGTLMDTVVKIDNLFTAWRYRHALMVHRMLGTKIGTGGSSGHDYLRVAADRSRIFGDFFNISSYLIPDEIVPELPEEVRSNLTFAMDRIAGSPPPLV